jgi:HEAT repeat protein
VNHLGVVRPHFPAFLADPDPVLRAEAVTQFGFADGAAASRALERALRDADRRVRRAAVEAAANVSAPETASLLIQALEDDDATVVRRAVCALGARGCRDAEQALTRLYARSDRDLQCDIAQALCWMDSRLGPEYKAQWERETGRPLIVSSEWDG